MEPSVTEEIRHSAGHVPGVLGVLDAKARWIGHELHADVAIEIDENSTVREARALAERLKHELFEHLPTLKTASIAFDTARRETPERHEVHRH